MISPVPRKGNFADFEDDKKSTEMGNAMCKAYCSVVVAAVVVEIPIYSLEQARCLEIQCNPSLCNLAVVFGVIALPGFTSLMSRKNDTQFGHF